MEFKSDASFIFGEEVRVLFAIELISVRIANCKDLKLDLPVSICLERGNQLYISKEILPSYSSESNCWKLKFNESLSTATTLYRTSPSGYGEKKAKLVVRFRKKSFFGDSVKSIGEALIYLNKVAESGVDGNPFQGGVISLPLAKTSGDASIFVRISATALREGDDAISIASGVSEREFVPDSDVGDSWWRLANSEKSFSSTPLVPSGQYLMSASSRIGDKDTGAIDETAAKAAEEAVEDLRSRLQSEMVKNAELVESLLKAELELRQLNEVESHRDGDSQKGHVRDLVIGESPLGNNSVSSGAAPQEYLQEIALLRSALTGCEALLSESQTAGVTWSNLVASLKTQVAGLEQALCDSRANAVSLGEQLSRRDRELEAEKAHAIDLERALQTRDKEYRELSDKYEFQMIAKRRGSATSLTIARDSTVWKSSDEPSRLCRIPSDSSDAGAEADGKDGSSCLPVVTSPNNFVIRRVLEKERIEASRQLEETQRRVCDLEAMITRMTEALQRKEEETDSLRLELDQLQRALLSTQGDHEQVLSGRTASLKSEHAKASDLTSLVIQQLRLEQTELRVQLSNALNTSDCMSKLLEHEKSENVRVVDELKRKILDHEVAIAKLEAEKFTKEQQFSSMEAEGGKAAAEIERLQGVVALNSSHISDLQATVDGFTKELESLTSAIDQESQERVRYKSLWESGEAVLAKQLGVISELNVRLTISVEQQQALEREVIALREEVESSVDRLRDRERLSVALEGQLHTVLLQIESLADGKAQAEKDAMILKQKLDDAAGLHSRCAEQEEALNEAVRGLTSRAESAEEALAEHRALLGAAEAEAHRSRAEWEEVLSRSVGEREVLEERLRAAEEDVSGLGVSLARAEREVRETREALEEAGKVREELLREEAIVAARSDAAEEALRKAREVWDTERTEWMSRLDDANVRVDGLEGSLSEMSRAVLLRDERLEEASLEVGRLSALIAESAAGAAQWQGKYEGVVREREELTLAVVKKDLMLSMLEEKVVSVKEEIERVRQQAEKDRTDSVKSFETVTSGLISQLQQQMERQGQEISVWREKSDGLSQQIQVVTLQKERVEKEFSKEQLESEVIKQRIKEMESAISEVEYEKSELASECLRREAIIEGKDIAIEEIKSQSRDTESQLRELITRLESEVSDMDSQLGDARDACDALAVEVAGLRGEVDALRQTHSSLQCANDVLHEELRVVESKWKAEKEKAVRIDNELSIRRQQTAELQCVYDKLLVDYSNLEEERNRERRDNHANGINLQTQLSNLNEELERNLVSQRTLLEELRGSEESAREFEYKYIEAMATCSSLDKRSKALVMETEELRGLLRNIELEKEEILRELHVLEGEYRRHQSQCAEAIIIATSETESLRKALLEESTKASSIELKLENMQQSYADLSASEAIYRQRLSDLLVSFNILEKSKSELLNEKTELLANFTEKQVEVGQLSECVVKYEELLTSRDLAISAMQVQLHQGLLREQNLQLLVEHLEGEAGSRQEVLDVLSAEMESSGLQIKDLETFLDELSTLLAQQAEYFAEESEKKHQIQTYTPNNPLSPTGRVVRTADTAPQALNAKVMDHRSLVLSRAQAKAKEILQSQRATGRNLKEHSYLMPTQSFSMRTASIVISSPNGTSSIKSPPTTPSHRSQTKASFASPVDTVSPPRHSLDADVPLRRYMRHTSSSAQATKSMQLSEMFASISVSTQPTSTRSPTRSSPDSRNHTNPLQRRMSPRRASV